MNGRLRVFLCGERQRGDDAAALLAADLLPPEVRERIELAAVGQLDAQHLLDLGAGEPCVVVDAVAGVAPGTVLVAALDRVAALAGLRHPRSPSTHALPLPDALALAGRLGAALRGSFVGVGGQCFALGDAPSGAVADALPAMAQAIVGEVDRLSPVETH
ncbi:MAG: hydrogenase maturation protease [Burkholderiales bacterium]|nr:hydrogenase maturation protease [Burkholderiales bacterium]